MSQLTKYLLSNKTVAVAGTREALASAATTATMVRQLTVCAKRAAADNTGNIFIGDSTLDQGVKEGIELAPGEKWEFPVPQGQWMDLSDVFIDADNADDGVVYVYSLWDSFGTAV